MGQRPMGLIDPLSEGARNCVTAPHGRRSQPLAAGSARPSAPAVASAPRLQLGDRLQPLEVAQDEAPMVESDQSVPPKSLQDAVDVHGGQAQRIGQIGLRERQANPIVLAQADRLHAPYDLAQEIGRRPLASRRPRATMRSRSMACSCNALHHRAAASRGWAATILVTVSRSITAIRVGPTAATEWSIASSRKPYRSKKSPGISTVRICRRPPDNSR